VPDLLLLDINMPYMDGMEAALAIRKRLPNIIIVFITMYYKPEIIAFAKQHHINGFITKTVMASELRSALRKILNGEKVFIIPEQFQKPESSMPEDEFICQFKLSPREIEVIQWIEKGITTKEIALKLGLRYLTVETHRKNIFRKLKVKNAAELVAFSTKYKKKSSYDL